MVFLPVRNAADPVTSELKALANHSLPMYASLTLAIGAAFVLVLAMLGRGKVLALHRFVLVGLEGVALRAGDAAVGGLALDALPLSSATSVADELVESTFGDIVMSLGAGFYEEIAFRVGALRRRRLGDQASCSTRAPRGSCCWSAGRCSARSSSRAGTTSDRWRTRSSCASSSYRAVCGLVLTGIYAFRGFAPAVWTHVLYDVWAMST